jgi:hypothetical protein
MADEPNAPSIQGLTDLNTTQQQGVRNLGGIIQAIRAVFPQQTGTSATATGGAATLPGNPVGFIVVALPNGTSVKVPYYAS